MDEIRILFVEDSEDDLLLLNRKLRWEGFDVSWRRVDTLADLEAALREQPWDVVVTDYMLPGFEGPDAIARVHRLDPDLPCIVVSGQIGEATAVASMRAGAADYIMKDNLQRLGPALRREVAESRSRRERTRVEAALLDERERHAITLRSIADGVVATDADGVVTLLNGAAERLCGWRAPEAVGKALGQVFRVMDEATRAPLDPLARSGTAGGAGGAPALPPRALLASRDGTERIVAITVSSLAEPADRASGSVLVFRDVTESVRLEREILRAQKLESVGVLAGGIAHDFNNILTGVLGNVSLARDLTPPRESAHTHLLEAERALVRARDLTLQLLTFARGGMPVRKPSSVAQLLKESAGFVLRGSTCRGVFDIPDDLFAADVDPGQISQVIQNLVLNAVQAMPEGGTVEVRARNLAGGDAEAPAATGRYVALWVRDTGPGIPAHLLDRIFDPYFTTKSGGTGLGLTSCYSIVRNHGGTLTVDSTPGQGATFRVVLPATGQVPAPEAAPEAPHHDGRGRILLMDDEAIVRSVASQLLAHLGYQVDTASEGGEAVRMHAAARQAGRPYDLVVVDLTVPGGMGGVEAAKAILQQDPGARIVVSSGYSADPVMAEFRSHGFAGVIGKPYTLQELSASLKRILGR